LQYDGDSSVGFDEFENRLQRGFHCTYECGYVIDWQDGM
jgi:hypothetical protein